MSSPAAEIPAERFLTTPSGKLNFRNALGRRRHYARKFRGAGYGSAICAAALRTDIRNEVEARADNELSAAADAVDTALFALDIPPTSDARDALIRAFHDGRPAILCNSRASFGSSIFADDVNEGRFADALEFLSRHCGEVDRHIALNDAGRTFLIRARALSLRSTMQRAA